MARVGPGSDVPVLAAEEVSLFLRQGGERRRVVDRVSFAIGSGECFALVGESGSGKTMIARAIMRLLPKAQLEIEGRLALEGIDLAGASEAVLRRLRGARMSMIFQEPMTSLNPLRTIEDQIAEIMVAHGRGTAQSRRARVRDLLAEVRFPDPERAAGLYPHELSGGMRQRAMIAMALANEPALLIADEPTASLDVTIQQEILDILEGLRRSRNMSVLLISHDLALVYRHADRVGVIYGGVLMEEGPAQQVMAAPSHPYTRALLACLPRPRQGSARQAGIEGTMPGIADWPPGCRFAPRCPARQEVCTAGAIPLVRPAPDRIARCLFPAPP